MSRKTSYEKAKFRQTKEWKDFREDFKLSNVDRLTEEPLKTSYILHHADLNPDNYKNLDKSHFMGFNSTYEHKLVHYVYEKYIRDPHFINRLETLIKEMVEINKWKGMYNYHKK